MRRISLMMAVFVFVTSCGNSETKPATPETTENKAPDLSANPDYKKGLALVANSDCLTCHKVDEALTGPAYADIAKKYEGQPSMIDTMAQRIIMGSSGHWGDQKMTPHPTLSLDDAKAMAKYVLLLNK